MPRRSILTATERENLLGWPEAHAELIRHYTLSANRSGDHPATPGSREPAGLRRAALLHASPWRGARN